MPRHERSESWRVLVPVPVVLDDIMEWAVVAFALWTVGYHASLLAPLNATVVWWVWLLLSAAAAVALTRARARTAIPDVTPAVEHAVAVAVGLVVALLASCLVRPDLDDASYTVRSTWVAARGAVNVGDVIFSNGAWPAPPGQAPYLPSFESLLGMSARILRVSPGTLIYSVYVPVAAFGAVWALWSLLRAWRAHRPALALAVAMVFVCWGGPLNASWGNLSIGRIWQGKVTLLALVVPLLYAWAARAVEAPAGRARLRALVLVGALGIAASGLDPAAVFVVPEIMVVTAVGALLVRRWRVGLVTAVVGGLYPLGSGVVAALTGITASGGTGAAPALGVNPWAKTIGTGWPARIIVVAALVALLGALIPRFSGLSLPVARMTAGASVVVGAALGLTVVYRLATDLMGTSAIVWRVAWVVPVPALIGLLVSAAPRMGETVRGVVAVVVVLALVVTGVPLWAKANHATLRAPGSWKMVPGDLDTARWIVGQNRSGRYLAPSTVVAAVGTISADLSPTGVRAPGYLQAYESVPGSLVDERVALQVWVDGAVGGARPPAAVAADLAALDVRVVCGAPQLAAGLGTDWSVAYRSAYVCWLREDAGAAAPA